MKKILSILLPFALLALILPYSAAADERVILTIGDINDRSGSRMDGDDQLGLWKYLEDQLDVEIKYVHMSREEYTAGLSNGNLPDIVATDNNLATILDNGVALNADPYLEEYVPNFITGKTRLAYEVFKQLLNDGDGFYFFPQKIGYNGVGNSNKPYNRGYIVRWDYYKELGYPPINSEDDYLNVLLQMHANHPFTEDGYPTYLYGTTNFRVMQLLSVQRSALITGRLTSIRIISSQMRYLTGIPIQSIPCSGLVWNGTTSSTEPEKKMALLIWRLLHRLRSSMMPNAPVVSISVS